MARYKESAAQRRERIIREDIESRASRAYAASRVPKNDRRRPREIEESGWNAWKRQFRAESERNYRRQSAIDKALPALVILGIGGLIVFQITK